jgi:Mg2+ and Co2+ transporter CorA
VSKKLKGVQRASQRTEQGFNSMSKEARENMRKVQRSTGQLDQSIEDLENELKELRQAKRKAFSGAAIFCFDAS